MAVAFGLKNCIWLCAAFFSEAGFLLTKYVMSLQETKMRGGYFCLGACSRGKNSP